MAYLVGLGAGAGFGCANTLMMGAVGAFAPNVLCKKELSKVGAIIIPMSWNAATFSLMEKNLELSPFNTGFKVGMIGSSIFIAATAEEFLKFKRKILFDDWNLVGTATGIVVAIALTPISTPVAIVCSMTAAAGVPPLARRVKRWIFSRS